MNTVLTNFVSTRTAEDMQVRNFSDGTSDSDTWHVDKFCHYIGKPADQLRPDEIRTCQLYLVNERKASWGSVKLAVCGLGVHDEVAFAKPMSQSVQTSSHQPLNRRNQLK